MSNDIIFSIDLYSYAKKRWSQTNPFQNIGQNPDYQWIDAFERIKLPGQFAMPDDLLEWGPTCHHKAVLMNVAETFVNLNKTLYLYMMYVWGHSYEFDHDHNWPSIESFCEFIGNRMDIWYATNIEIVDYLKAFQNLTFSASCQFVYNPSALSVWLQVDNHLVEIKGGSQTAL